MKQCPLVLEGCPNKCGEIVERCEMQHHMNNKCMNKQRPTDNIQLTTHPLEATSPQATSLQHNFDPVPMLQQHETQHQVEMYGYFWKVI
jgi:hypothetical protein